MKLKDRDKAALLIVLSVIILVAVYFGVFTRFNDKTSTLKSENATLQDEVNTLQSMEARKDEVQADTDAKVAQVNEIIKDFPSEVRTEGIIKEFYDMYHSEIKSVKIESESYTMNTPFYGADASADGQLAAAEAPAETVAEDATTTESTEEALSGDATAEQLIAAQPNMVGYQSIANVTFTTSYNGVKQVIDFINENENRMVINTFNIAPGDVGNRYSVTIQASFFTLSGTGKEYVEPKIRGVKEGTPNIFK